MRNNSTHWIHSDQSKMFVFTFIFASQHLKSLRTWLCKLEHKDQNFIQTQRWTKFFGRFCFKCNSIRKLSFNRRFFSKVLSLLLVYPHKISSLKVDWQLNQAHNNSKQSLFRGRNFSDDRSNQIVMLYKCPEKIESRQKETTKHKLHFGN